MNHTSLALAAAGALGTTLLLGGGLWAQNALSAKPASRAGLVRRPGPLPGPALNDPAASVRMAHVTAVLRGTILLFEYDPNRTVDLDLGDDGSFGDPGDRTILQGKIWQSNRSGAKLADLGQVASVYDYLDPFGAQTGTDLTVTHDMRFANGGQVRAGGFWNVSDVVGAPSLGIEGATGSSSLRVYRTGQLVFLSRVNDNSELYLLAK